MTTFRGRPLLYNAFAHFAAQDAYPERVVEEPGEDGRPQKRRVGGLVDTLGSVGADGLTALCWALEVMSEQAAAVRKLHGMRTPEPLSATALAAELRPTEIAPARAAVFEAISRGLRAPSGENDEIDEVLEELGKNGESR